MNFDFKFYGPTSPDGIARHESLFRNQLTLKGLQVGNIIDRLKTEGISITETDYIVYSLFKDKNEHLNGYRNLEELRRTVEVEIPRFRNRFEYGDTVRSVLNRNEQNGADRTYTEYNGVAGSLIATNNIFGLTNADYTPIEEGPNKTLDYTLHLASLGNRFIIIESKGVMGLTSPISDAANDIIKKKNKNYYSLPGNRDLYFGLVTQIPYANENRNGQITLVDPEIPDLSLDARKVKFKNRLSYYHNIFSLITSPRVYEYYYAIRVFLNESSDEDWERVANAMLNSAPGFNRFSPWQYYQVNTVSKELPYRLFAVAVPINENEYFLIGLFENDVKSIMTSNVNQLLEFKIKERVFELESIDLRFRRRIFGPSNRYDIKGYGQLKQYSSGIVAGVIKDKS